MLQQRIVTIGLLALLGISLWVPHAAQSDPRARAEYYIDVYGEISEDQHPLVARAKQVFETVRHVADAPVGVTPRLRIINSDSKPWAIALPDGYVILSKGALDICYRGTDQETGDARLAFVLGHELAHLTSNDFWHREIYLSLAGSDSVSSLSRVKELVAGEFGGNGSNNWKDTVKRKELQADDAGFLYASLAGYPTQRILANAHQHESFLNYWVKQTRSYNDELHLGPTERSDFLSNRFSILGEKAELFRAAVRLAHFGRYRDAQHLFEDFSRTFPAYEVLTNLGYVHLHQGLEYLSPEWRYRFWLPTSMENAPSLLSSVRNFGNGLPKQAKEHLQQSVTYLTQAAALRPDATHSRINLATAYFYLGEYYKARAVVEEVRQLSPDHQEALLLRALILNDQEKDIDMWPVAVRALQKLSDTGYQPAKYNLARLMADRGREAEAFELWREQLTQNQLPSEFKKALCKWPEFQPVCPAVDTRIVKIPSQLMAPEVFDSLKNKRQKDQSASDLHTHWQSHFMTLDNYLTTEDHSISFVDGKFSVAELTPNQALSSGSLLKLMGEPRSRSTLGTSSLWSYSRQWAALVENDEVKKIWLSSNL